ncbi:uncharacterized protein [Prorops nasuta]|uniref:uncharacterized protein n=1 Tax=Prorops nasuta TaxID=863751 RepID=UPI0034CF82C3
MSGSSGKVFIQLMEENNNVVYDFLVTEEIYSLICNDPSYAKQFLQKHKKMAISKSQEENLASTSEKSNTEEVQSTELQEEINRQQMFCISTDISNQENEEENVDDPEPSCSNISSDRNVRHHWSLNETKLLLHIFSEINEKIQTKKLTYSNAWKSVAAQMKAYKYFFTPSQCCAKIENLKKMYKNIVDHNRQSGNSRKTMENFDILDKIFGKMPYINPVSTAGTSIPLSQHLEDNRFNKGCKRSSVNDLLSEIVELKKKKLEVDKNYKQEKLNILKDIKDKL